jgi:5'-nucleotidase
MRAFVTLTLALACSADPARADAERTAILVLGLNDFHGQLASSRVDGRPAGGAAVLTAYLRHEMARFRGASLIVHAGDWVGASPPSSGLLGDEPSIALLGLLGGEACSVAEPLSSRCPVVGTLGNHEFDDGVPELLRLLGGGKPTRSQPFAEPWRGAAVSYVSSNVVRAGGAPLLPGSVVKDVGGVRVGVIGAVLHDTPTMVVASGVRGVRFLDEAERINAEARRLTTEGVHAQIVAIHQGHAQPAYAGDTDPAAELPDGPLMPILRALEPSVDVVVSGHAHAFSNALVPRAGAAPLLVTQAWSGGRAYAAIELGVDRARGEVLEKRARIVTTFGDAGPGLAPAADAATLVARAEALVAPLAGRVVGSAPARLSARPNEHGESALGNLAADAQRRAARADVALMNQAGLRSPIEAGEVSWGALFAVHPFGNALVTLTLTGRALRQALEEQWDDHDTAHRLDVSGITYTWDPARPRGSRVVSLLRNGQPVRDTARLRVAVNAYLAEGGSGFRTLAAAPRRDTGLTDLDALLAYVRARHGVLAGQLDGRVRRAVGGAAATRP